MENNELFMDVEYDDVDHRYEKKEEIKIVPQNVYEVNENVKPDITKVDGNEILDERLRFLKKNILTEIEIGVLFSILIFTSLMTLYEIFKISILKQILYWFFIAILVIVVLYFVLAEYRIHKVKKSIKQ